MVLRDLGLEQSTPIGVLVAKRPKVEELLLLAGAKLVNAEDTTLHRSMRENYLSLHRPHLSFAPASVAREMKSPTTKDLRDQKIGSLTKWPLKTKTSKVSEHLQARADRVPNILHHIHAKTGVVVDKH